MFLDVYILNYCYPNKTHVCGISRFYTLGDRTIKWYFKMRTVDCPLLWIFFFFQLGSLIFIHRLLVENGALCFLYSIFCFSLWSGNGKGWTVWSDRYFIVSNCYIFYPTTQLRICVDWSQFSSMLNRQWVTVKTKKFEILSCTI